MTTRNEMSGHGCAHDAKTNETEFAHVLGPFFLFECD
jgi:hypothetical protein